MKEISKKIVVILLLVVTIFTNVRCFAFSIPIKSASIINKGECDRNLQFYDSNYGWYNIVCYYNAYNFNGVEYPAYCLNPALPGVGELPSYDVDLTKLLDDVTLWRTYKNGFPYKSAQELGVDNDFDAYLATKQAGYCIIFNRNPEEVYRGRNERGNRIHKALVNIVNAGRNGTDMPNSANIKLNKIGEFYEDGDYYSQIFKIESNTNIKNYTITSTAGLPDGSIITNENNEQKLTFNSGENFVVKVPKNSLIEDIESIINVQVACKSYPIFYGKSSIPNAQDYVVTFDPYGDETGRIDFNVKTNSGKIKINKIDDETSQPVEGVTFKLMKENGVVVGTATTDKNGVVEFEKLYQGKYKLQEVETNSKYVLNDIVFDVQVEYNKTVEITVENEHKKGNIKVCKVDKDNNKITLGGVEFDLYSEEFDKVIGTYYTDSNGELEINDLRIGNYSLIEKSTNKWYNLTEDTEVNVEWDITQDVTVENELKKGQIKIIKVDEENNEIKLENVKFVVMDKDGKVLEELITDKNGEAITQKYPIRDFSELKIQEVETNEEYVLDDTMYTIELEENQIKDVVFENEKIKGQIEVIKVSANDNKLTGDKKGAFLEGAVFEVYNLNNELVETLITNEEGKAISKLLEKGEYYLKEIDSGSPYYLINSDIFKVEIKEHEEIVSKKIEDDSVDIEVEVEKEGFKETQSKDSIYYDFSNIHNKSNVSLDEFTWTEILPTNALRANRIYTGIWNEELEYSIWYKTNLSEKYIMLQDNLNTQINNLINFNDIELGVNEYITEFEFRFGTVKPGFREIEQPRLYCDVLENLGNGFTFVNYTKVSGNYKGKYVEDEDNWKTIIYHKELQLEKLPQTGKYII